MMNVTTYYKKRRLRQKPNILTYEQQQELSKLIVGKSQSKQLIDQGLIPTSLFRLRKRKLESLYDYLLKHDLIHCGDKPVESMHTLQLAEYLLNIIYPGYPACRAKNLAFTEYRECRERDATAKNSAQQPLAYDFVPTTEMYDRVDEIIRIDVDDSSTHNQQYHGYVVDNIPFPNTGSSTSMPNNHKVLQLSVSHLKKSIERVRYTNKASSTKQQQQFEYHLYFWNSTRTLVKPHCKVLQLQSMDIWTDKDEKMIQEGFMHVDITASLINCLKQVKGQRGKSSFLTLAVELVDHEEQNINHISISAVTKKPVPEIICQLYLQSTTECMDRAIRKSQHPSDTQRIIIHLLKQYNRPSTLTRPDVNRDYIDEETTGQDEDDSIYLASKLRRAESLFMTCTSNSSALYLATDSTELVANHYNNNMSGSSTASEEDYDDEDEGELVSLIDSLSYPRSKIQHPLKSMHCQHRTCFDAGSFLRYNVDKKIWHCPICSVHIKNFEDLRMDYSMKVALNEYPDEEQVYMFGDGSIALVSDDDVVVDQEEVDYIDMRLAEEREEVPQLPPNKRLKTLHVM